jgi:hypothetical protein
MRVESSITKPTIEVRLDIDRVLHGGVGIHFDSDGHSPPHDMFDGPHTGGVGSSGELSSAGICDSNMGVGQQRSIDCILDLTLHSVGDWHTRLWELTV